MIKQELDPIKYEMFFNRIEQTMYEGKEVIRKLSASVIARDAGEVSQGIYTKDGRLAHMAASILLHGKTISRSINYMLDNDYGSDIGIYEGDQFINNDPFIGGTHRPDQLLIAPLFYQGKHIGWTGNFSHVSEIGAIEPGGMCPSATESCHEGILLPCVKIVEKGKTRRDVFVMMALTGRVSREMEIDTRAKIAGNERIRRRITEIIDEYGIDFFLAAMDTMLEQAELQAIQKIRALRPGIYRNRVFVDHTGQEEKLSIIEVETEVTKNGELKLSAPVISPQRKSFNNTPLAGVESVTISELLIHYFYDIRWNEGVLKPVSIEIPEKSMLNPDRTAAVAFGLLGVAFQWEHCLNDVLSRAIFVSGNDKDVMASGVNLCCDVVGGIDKFGRQRVSLILDAVAYPGGARCDMDGINSSAFFCNPWSEAPDIESTEMDLPVLALGRYLVPDTGGFGKFRGGNAVEGVYLTHGSHMGHAGWGTGGKAHGTQGLFGGYPGTLCRMIISRNSQVPELIAQMAPLPHSGSDLIAGVSGGVLEFLPSTTPFVPLHERDIISTIQWGAPGLGDPLEREPAMIVKDLMEKHTTLKVAKEIYCVAVDPETFTVDEKKTDLMRAQRRKERLAKGIPAWDYIRKMVEARNNGTIPAQVLSFLEETKEFSERFRQELEAEESMKQPDMNQGENIIVKEELFKLTPHVAVVETNTGKGILCSHCGHYYCDAGDNFKHYSLVYDRDPKEIHGDRLGADKDLMIFREFYCPGCGHMVEVEATPPFLPILNNYELAI